MTFLVVGIDCPVARALHDSEPVARLGAAAGAILEQRPDQIAIVALAAPIGPVGAAAPAALAELAGRTITLAVVVAKLAAQLEQPVRIAILSPADGVIPDHHDGARSVVAAGLTMLTEVASALPLITINTIAVADDVPPQEVAALTRFVLSGATPSLNGATIRLDGGRDAVLAFETRAEGD